MHRIRGNTETDHNWNLWWRLDYTSHHSGYMSDWRSNDERVTRLYDGRISSSASAMRTDSGRRQRYRSIWQLSGNRCQHNNKCLRQLCVWLLRTADTRSPLSSMHFSLHYAICKPKFADVRTICASMSNSTSWHNSRLNDWRPQHVHHSCANSTMLTMIRVVVVVKTLARCIRELMPTVLYHATKDVNAIADLL